MHAADSLLQFNGCTVHQAIHQLYKTQAFITKFSMAYHLSLSLFQLIQSVPFHPISVRPTLSSHLYTGFSSALFPSGFFTNTLYAIFFSPHMPHGSPTSSSLHVFTLISGEAYKSQGSFL